MKVYKMVQRARASTRPDNPPEGLPSGSQSPTASALRGRAAWFATYTSLAAALNLIWQPRTLGRRDALVLQTLDEILEGRTGLSVPLELEQLSEAQESTRSFLDLCASFRAHVRGGTLRSGIDAVDPGFTRTLFHVKCFYVGSTGPRSACWFHLAYLADELIKVPDSASARSRSSRHH
jgi:hypothetical protein